MLEYKKYVGHYWYDIQSKWYFCMILLTYNKITIIKSRKVTNLIRYFKYKINKHIKLIKEIADLCMSNREPSNEIKKAAFLLDKEGF